MSLQSTSVLVTGGAGFIGSNIAEHLVKNGAKHVRILDNLVTGKRENIDPLLKIYPNLEFMYGDTTNLEICRKAVIGIDVVCHQAALGSVPRSIDDPLNSHNSNVNGFFNILLACKEVGIKRVVYASSSSVYGSDQNLPKKEEFIGKQLSPYAITKYIDELYGYIFTYTYGLECIGLRYFNVFGPRQDPNGVYAAVIPKFINMMLKGNRPIINGDGNYSRDFTYVDNVVQANVKALMTTNSRCYGEIFNIGAGGRVSIKELFESIKNNLGTDIEPVYDQIRKGDIPHSNACIDKAKQELGYDPMIGFDEGIRRTIDYIKCCRSQ